MPDDLVLPPAESLVEAQRLLDAGRPFHAHEVLEGTWKAAPDAERDLWQGLAQLAVGLTHRARGNPAGAQTLLQRGAAHIEPYAGAPPYGIDVDGLLAAARPDRSPTRARPASPLTMARRRTFARSRRARRRQAQESVSTSRVAPRPARATLRASSTVRA